MRWRCWQQHRRDTCCTPTTSALCLDFIRDDDRHSSSCQASLWADHLRKKCLEKMHIALNTPVSGKGKTVKLLPSTLDPIAHYSAHSHMPNPLSTERNEASPRISSKNIRPVYPLASHRNRSPSVILTVKSRSTTSLLPLGGGTFHQTARSSYTRLGVLFPMVTYLLSWGF